MRLFEQKELVTLQDIKEAPKNTVIQRGYVMDSEHKIVCYVIYKLSNGKFSVYHGGLSQSDEEIIKSRKRVGLEAWLKHHLNIAPDAIDKWQHDIYGW